MKLPNVQISEIVAAIYQRASDNTIRDVYCYYVYGDIGSDKFIVQGEQISIGQNPSTLMWTGMWSWTCNRMLSDAERRKIIKSIKNSSLLNNATANATILNGDEMINLYKQFEDGKIEFFNGDVKETGKQALYADGYGYNGVYKKYMRLL